MFDGQIFTAFSGCVKITVCDVYETVVKKKKLIMWALLNLVK